MAALKEARSYGLSCGRVSDGSRVSVFHVKLTDSALKAFESYRAHQVSFAASWRVGCAVGRHLLGPVGEQGRASIPGDTLTNLSDILQVDSTLASFYKTDPVYVA